MGCDHKTVGKYRGEQERTGEIPQSEKRTGADGRTIDTSNIGGKSSDTGGEEEGQKSLPTKTSGDRSPTRLRTAPCRASRPTQKAFSLNRQLHLYV